MPDFRPPSPATAPDAAALASARRTFAIEIQALDALLARLDERFSQAVALLLACRGRVVVTGLGKSGHVGRKLAATLASTGTPAFFMHAGEAIHGDLGMLTADDVVLALSYSGRGDEMQAVITVTHRLGIPLIAITGHADSELARNADIFLDAHVEQEACPLNLAPTASTTAALVLGDALAIACLAQRGFSPEDFARSHPGGALGRRLLTRVDDVMRHGDALPLVTPAQPLPDALVGMSAKGMGMVIAVEHGRPVGIFTDGDLRRLILEHGDIRTLTVADGMTRAPQALPAGALAVQAAAIMDARRLNQLLVVDADGLLLGALHMHDLLAAKVI